MTWPVMVEITTASAEAQSARQWSSLRFFCLKILTDLLNGVIALPSQMGAIHIVHKEEITYNYTYANTFQICVIVKCFHLKYFDVFWSWGATAKTRKPALRVESTSKQETTPPEKLPVLCRLQEQQLLRNPAWHLVSYGALGKKGIQLILKFIIGNNEWQGEPYQFQPRFMDFPYPPKRNTIRSDSTALGSARICFQQ